MKKVQAAILIAVSLISLNLFAMEEFNANNCELYVDGFAQTYGGYGNMGLWSKALRSEIRVNSLPSTDQVLKVGQWIKLDNGNEFIVSDERFHGLMLYKNGYDQDKGLWVIEVPFEGVEYGGGYGERIRYNFDIVETAYFLDIKKEGGRRVRLWLSNNGQNFSPLANLSNNTHYISNGPNYIKWADQKSPIFAQKHFCR